MPEVTRRGGGGLLKKKCPVLRGLRTTSAILAGAHSDFVVSSFKCVRENNYHDLSPNPYKTKEI